MADRVVGRIEVSTDPLASHRNVMPTKARDIYLAEVVEAVYTTADIIIITTAI